MIVRPLLMVLVRDPSNSSGNAEARRDSKTEPAQADKTQGLRSDSGFINIPGGVQRDDSDLTHDRNSFCTKPGSAE